MNPSNGSVSAGTNDVSSISPSEERMVGGSSSWSPTRSLFSQGRNVSFVHTINPNNHNLSFVANRVQPSLLASRQANTVIEKESDVIVKERSYRLAKSINSHIHPHSAFATHGNWYRISSRRAEQRL